MTIAADPALLLFVYTAEAGTKSAETLRLLGTLAAMQTQEASIRETS